MTDGLTVLRGLFPALVGSTLPLPAGRVELSAGEVLCHEGEPADCAWLVVRGRLQVVSGSGGDDRSIRVGVGALIGESGLLDDGVRNATVLAVRETVLLVLDRGWLAEVLRGGAG